MNFKAILLDLDNTLYDYDFCHKEAFKKIQILLKKNLILVFLEVKNYTITQEIM